MKIQDLEASESDRKARARQRLSQRVVKGADEQTEAVRKAVETVIVDRYYYPAKMQFSVSHDDKIVLTYVGEGKPYHIHNHALGQMASVCGIPRKFVSDLRESRFESNSPSNAWQSDLLAYNLNTLFHERLFANAKKKPIKYLRRAVGDEVRGFQGANFKRSLATAPLIRTFLERCAKHKAGPIEAVTTPVKTILKCIMPYVFEPVDGEFVALGASFINSDFGAAKTGVSGTILRISSGTISVMEDGFSKIHLGRAVEADDDADLTISDETLKKELEAHQSGISDVIDGQLSVESIEKTLKAIEAAHEHGIEWYKLRNSLSKVLSKNDIDFVKNLLTQGDDLMDLPAVGKNNAGEPQATGWWTANVLGWMASKAESEDKKQDLQKLAGELVAA